MLAYKTWGDLSCPALIFLHGFIGTKEDWEPLIQLLSPLFFSIAIDLPGHGASGWHSDWDEALSQTIKKLPPLTHPTLVGYSMGGRVALQYSCKMPRILLSTHLGLDTQEEKEARWAQDLLWASRLQNLPLSDFYALWYEQPLFKSLEARSDLKAHLLQRPHRTPSLLSKALLHKSLALQEKVSTPPLRTLFLCGENDEKFLKLYETEQKKWGLEAPYFAFYQIIAKAGHALHLENPEGCAEILCKFKSTFLDLR